MIPEKRVHSSQYCGNRSDVAGGVNECRMSNNEFRVKKLSLFGFPFELRHSLFDILRFALEYPRVAQRTFRSCSLLHALPAMKGKIPRKFLTPILYFNYNNSTKFDGLVKSPIFMSFRAKREILNF